MSFIREKSEKGYVGVFRNTEKTPVTLKNHPYTTASTFIFDLDTTYYIF